jgi:hypothetical protein
MNYQELLHSPIFSAQSALSIQKAGRHVLPVLILGERGTGKELAAKIIHALRERESDRFYKIDCRLLSAGSFDDQLPRLLKEGAEGPESATLYLKEVGSLRQETQARLLELVGEGFLYGGVSKRHLRNVRMIASSSEKLKEKVQQGNFLEDLYHRFNLLAVYLPPLRERSKEIPAIVRSILADHGKKMNLNGLEVSEQVLRLFQTYWWPENIRELEHVLLRSAVFSEGNRLTEKDLFFETGPEGNSFVDFLRKSGINPAQVEREVLSSDPNGSPLPLFFIELVHRIKNPLVSIKTFAQLLREKFSDPEFRDTFYHIVTEDIERIDRVLNDLLGYIKVNSPLPKANTVNVIVEEVLGRHQAELETKKVRVFKKLEGDLPETIVHEEHLKYILDSILQFAVPSIPQNGSLGFLTKSFEAEKGRAGNIGQNEGQIEILIAYTGCRKSAERVEAMLGIPGAATGEPIELELRLAKEMILKNRGLIKLEINESKPRTLISMKFPVERRKTVSYPS